MIRFLIAVTVGYICCASSVKALKCYEGLNATFNGIPLYFWQPRDCMANSKCVGQEMSVQTDLGGGTVLHSALQYGACMGSAYSDYLDCKNLYGETSKFDPAKLLDMVPFIEVTMNKTVNAFARDWPGSLGKLLSNGTAIESFVKGAYTFHENLGFNLTKAEPLKIPISNILKSIFNSNQSSQNVWNRVLEFYNAFANLDTNDKTFSTNARQLLGRFGVNVSIIVENDIQNKIMIDKLPGLFRSIFPPSWRPKLWFDVALNMVGDMDPTNWTKTAENLANRIRTSYQIPLGIQPYLYPFLNRLPDLAKQSQVNPSYVGNWSLGLLQHFSEVDPSTAAFSSSLTSFIESFGFGIQYEFKATIQFLPGLFYKFFPGNKADIQSVYKKMTDGFKSFDFKNLSKTSEVTPLSTMTVNLINKIGGNVTKESMQQNPLYNTLIVNFAKMFTDLMKVKEDYTSYLTKFSNIVDAEFNAYPNVNVGKLVTDLTIAMGGKVPDQVVPLLDNVQSVITAGMQSPYSPKALVDAVRRVTSAYIKAYPKSPFPQLIDKYISIMYNLTTFDGSSVTMTEVTISNTTWMIGRVDTSKIMNLTWELQYWIIDMEFAIVKSFNYDNDELYKLLKKSFPEFDLYIRMMRAMNPQDVKQLMKQIVSWAANGPFSTQGFIDATKPTFMKLTDSIKALMKDVRFVFSPNTCKLGSCEADLCNTHSYVSAQKAFIKTATTTTSPTSSATKNGKGYKITFALAVLWISMFFFM